MSKKIIQIDQDKCVGCGLCASACQQGAIAMVDGKAKVVRDDYCDGIGNCLPVCPVSAISFSDVDIKNDKPHSAVAVNVKKVEIPVKKPAFTCPGTMAKSVERKIDAPAFKGDVPSMISSWPVQIKLVPTGAKYFDGANLLIAADCTAFAYGNFHAEFMRNKVTIIGCPKLDSVDYTEKLTAIIAGNNIKSVTCTRMEVPCCGGLQNAVENALKASGKFIPWQIVTIGIDGRLIEN